MLKTADKLGGKVLRVRSRPTIATRQHLAATGHTGQQSLHRVGDGFAQKACGLVFQVGALDKVLLNSLFQHGRMIPAQALPMAEQVLD